jgi:hypothetical protein
MNVLANATQPTNYCVVSYLDVTSQARPVRYNYIIADNRVVANMS